jgi:hypothetical protein
MTEQQLPDSVEQVVSRTEVERYRELCCADGLCTPWDQAGHQALMYVLAAIPEPKGHIEVCDCLKLETPAARRYGLTEPPTYGRSGSCSPEPPGPA